MGYYDNYLEHHGIMGQKWGVRRYQNEDGSLTGLGYRHYGVTKDRKGGKLIDAETGKKIRKSEVKTIVKDMKKNDKELYKEYKSYKKDSKDRRMTYVGNSYLTAALVESNNRSVKALMKTSTENMNRLLAEYGNKKMSELSSNEPKNKTTNNSEKAPKKETPKTTKKQVNDDYYNSNGSHKAANPEKHEALAKEHKATTGFSNFIAKQTGGFDQIDDWELLDLLAQEYEEDTGKKAFNN